MSNISDCASTDWKQWLEFCESKWEIVQCRDNPKPQRKYHATNLRLMIDWVIISMFLYSCYNYVCEACLPLAKKLNTRTNSRGPFALCRNGQWVQSTLRWGMNKATCT